MKILLSANSDAKAPSSIEPFENALPISPMDETNSSFLLSKLHPAPFKTLASKKK